MKKKARLQRVETAQWRKAFWLSEVSELLPLCFFR